MAFINMETGNPLGQRPLNLMSRQQGMGWLGAAPTPGDYDNNQQVLGELVAMGAISQDDANNIWSGTASLDDMAVNMTMINQALALTGQQGAQTVQPLPPSSPNLTVVPYTPLPSSSPSSPSVAASAPSTPTNTATPQIPSGSTITYTVSWTPGIGNLTMSGANVIAAMQKALPTYRMAVTASSQTASYASIGSSGYTVQFTILDSVGHQNVSDAQSVLDATMRQIVGNNLSSSSITGVYPPGLPGVAAQLPAPSFTSWIEQNVGLMVGLVLAVVLVPPLIRKL